MRIKFDFGDLDAFLAVVDLGSFQRAAEKLNLSQSALTRRIQKLEAALNVTLFERTTRSTKMTLAAKSLRDRAQTLIDDASEAIRAVSDETARYDFQKNAIITVAAIPTATHNILPNAIRAFRQLGQTARIRVLDHFANEVVEAVSQGEADIGVGFFAAEEPGLTFKVLLEENFVLAMHKTHKLRSRRRVRWSEIQDLEIIAPWKGTGNRTLIDNALARHHIYLNPKFEVRHSSTLLGLTENKIGLAILPASAIPVRDQETIISRPLVEPEIGRVIGLVRRTGHNLSSAAEKFYDLLGKQACQTKSRKTKTLDVR